MYLRNYMKRLIVRGMYVLSRSYLDQLDSNRSDVNVFLAASLSETQTLSELNDPASYIGFLRCCLGKTSHQVESIKSTGLDRRDTAVKRFTTLLERLQQGAEPIPYPMAQKLALVADRFYGNYQPLETANWAGDVGLHFRVSSSIGAKARLLANTVRFMRPTCCLELGTAYGMSGMVILSVMAANGDMGHLATIECSEPAFSLASEMLTNHFGQQTLCLKGYVQDRLPDALNSLGKIDLLFHDAGHSREDYVDDFSAAEPYLASGAVVIIDDIRWDNPRSPKGLAHCYEGWEHIVSHPRVRVAAEIDESLGIVLME